MKQMTLCAIKSETVFHTFDAKKLLLDQTDPCTTNIVKTVLKGGLKD